LFVAFILFLIFYIIVTLISKLLFRSLTWRPTRKGKGKDGSPVQKDEMKIQMAHFIVVAVKILLWVQIVPILIGQVGIAVDSIVAVVSAVTVGIGLSMRSMAENFVMGVILIIIQPFKVGDLVSLGGRTGTVARTSFAYTIIKEPDGKEVFLPNAKVGNSNMINLTSHGKARLDVGTFHLPHGTSLKAARDSIIQAVLSVPEVQEDPPPKMLVGAITQTSVEVFARVWVPSAAQLVAPFAVREAVFERLRVDGVPLVTWKAEVGSALEGLAAVGYPGLREERATPTSALAAGGAGSTDRADEQAAAAGIAVLSNL